MLIRFALAGLVILGLWGAGQLSIRQFMSGDACPIFGETLPACYIALAGYLLIAAGVLVSFVNTRLVGVYLFWTGMVIAGGLAALASGLELIFGHVCPLGFSKIPMCYISVVFSAMISMLFVASRIRDPCKL